MKWLLILMLMLTAPAANAAPNGVSRVDEFAVRLDARVPELLRRYLIPSAAVAIVHDGRVTTRVWGLADLSSGQIADTHTRYNIASISKVLTAWGVMALVDDGRIALDDPVSKHVKRWRSPDEAITIGRLLSHTAGLSMAAVPQYEEAPPSLETMLAPIVVEHTPGKAVHYSGGGYGVLQLLIEEVSGQPFETFMQKRVLGPLGMKHSSFVPVVSEGMQRRAGGPQSTTPFAVPYDASLRPLPHYRFAATAAAGLYTTIDDLALLAAAKPPAIMLAPVDTVEKTPFRYGLGYSLLALPSGAITAGHSGSNDGWTSILETIPGTGDALVVLANRSDAFPLYRDLMCEWLLAAKGENWPGFCNPDRWTWTKEDAAFVEQSFAAESAAVLVAIGDEVVHRKAYGTVTPETPFYVASLAKSLTAHAVLALAGEGKLSLSDPLGRWLPDAPPWMREVTLEQLLSHTSGVPDYYGLIDWGTYDGIDNAEVLALLAAKGKPAFAPGARYAYSNSGYVLLAMAAEKTTGRPFAEVLRRTLLVPAGMRNTLVYDGTAPAPAGRAIGRDKETLSDYLEVTLPNGKTFPFRATTVGAGGIFTTVDDLFRMTRTHLLPFGLEQLATSPRTPVEGEIELPETTGHGFGWFVSRRAKTNVVWNAGGFAGHKTFIVRVPRYDATIIVLANTAEAKPVDLAMGIVDRLLQANTR
jgi:CubicO group peptidase (beta-lactamase class C family)